MITRGGGDHAASERNEFDAVKTEVKNMKEDIKKMRDDASVAG